MTYETLDSIADAYVPLLALLALMQAIYWAGFRYKVRAIAAKLAVLTCLLGLAYLLMFIEMRLELWSSASLDYSTHTAVACVLVVFLCFCNKAVWPVVSTSLAVYVLLMLYQEYHTVADILSTALVLAVLIFPCYFLVLRRHLSSALC